MTDILMGAVVELFFAALALGLLYRVMAGKFLVPKREVILPYQRGAIVQGSETVRVVDPGSCWVRPKQRIVLCDVRTRPFQMMGVEVLSRDGGIFRTSLNGTYKVGDPAVFYKASTSAAEAFLLAIRKALFQAARAESSGNLLAAPEMLTKKLKELVVGSGADLGMELLTMDIWEVSPFGHLPQPAEDLSGPLVH